MARVEVDIEETTIEDGDGFEREGVIATCTQCDHKTESFGTTDRSRRRCLALMRDECPLGEANYYVDQNE